MTRTGRLHEMETLPESPLRFNSPFRIGDGPSISPTGTRRQEISSPSGPIGPVEVRNAQPFHTSINGNSAKHGDPAPNFSKIIGNKLSKNSSANVYSRCWMNFTRDAFGTKTPNFMNLGIFSVHTSDELRFFRIAAKRIGRHINGSN